MSTRSSAEVTVSRSSPRVERKRQQKIRDILAVTADLLNERGFHALTLDEVAERVDLTKATLYHYFAGKDQLVAECIKTIGGEVNERLELLDNESVRSGAGAEQRLRTLLQDRLAVIVLDFPAVGQMFSQPHDWPGDLHDLTRDLRHRHEALLQEVVQSGIASGEFSAGIDVRVALNCAFGATNYAAVWVRKQSRAAMERQFSRIVDHVMRIFVDGVAIA